MTGRIRWLVMLLATALCMGFAGGATAREVASVEFPEQVRVDGETLILNGAGIRKKFFVSVYAAGLYLTAPAGSAEAALTVAPPKRVTMHFLHREVGRDKLRDSWRDGFDENLDAASRKPLEAELQKFIGLFPDLHAGDTVQLDQLGDGSTEVRIKGALVGHFAQAGFFNALLQVWLGEAPADRSLKKALLEGR